jgi:hypothetical protein
VERLKSLQEKNLQDGFNKVIEALLMKVRQRGIESRTNGLLLINSNHRVDFEGCDRQMEWSKKSNDAFCEQANTLEVELPTGWQLFVAIGI